MMKIINIAIRVILGGVFVFAGVVKIIDPATFANDIGNYRLLPRPEWPEEAVPDPAGESMETVTYADLLDEAGYQALVV